MGMEKVILNRRAMRALMALEEMSQVELSKAVKIERGMISLYLNGLACPSDRAKALADALGVDDVDDIICEPSGLAYEEE